MRTNVWKMVWLPSGGGEEEVSISSVEFAFEPRLLHERHSIETPDLDALGFAGAVEVQFAHRVEESDC